MKHKDYTVINQGTAVTRALLDRLSSPDDALKIIHIAGTNGKGSTAEFFTSILISAGKKTGTFTSPQVYGFYDQFRIDGKSLSPEKAESYFGRALKCAEGLGATDFEIQTAGILLAFKEEGCEYAVIECGMGGLGDATNAVNAKELAVITSVSLEHTAYLGDTAEKICVRKAGIIKNCPAVINAYQPYESAERYLRKTGGIFADGLVMTGGKSFVYGGKEYELSAEGSLQAYNAVTAIEGAKILGLPETSIYEGIKSAKPRGRIEKFSASGKNYILDGAHNPSAFEPLAAYLGGIPRKYVTLIFGCLADKDIEGILSVLAGCADNITAVGCNSPRARTAEETGAACGKYFGNVKTADSVSSAMEMAATDTVVVCGSFTLLKEAKEWIEKRQ